MDAIGLLTTAAIFSEKSNIELRVFVTPQVSVQDGITTGNYVNIPGAENLNLAAVGIINVYLMALTSNNTSYTVFSEVYASPLTQTEWQYISRINFIYQNNTCGFNLSRDTVARYRYGISIKLTNSGSLQAAAITYASNSGYRSVSPQVIPCILIY